MARHLGVKLSLIYLDAFDQIKFRIVCPSLLWGQFNDYAHLGSGFRWFVNPHVSWHGQEAHERPMIAFLKCHDFFPVVYNEQRASRPMSINKKRKNCYHAQKK